MFRFMTFTTSIARKSLATGLVATALLASGCATPPDPSDEAAVQAFNEANDPLEPMNRYFFEVNHAVDELLVKPFAGYYNIALPDPAKDGVRNFMRNLRSPVILFNDLFQGEGSRAGTTAARFLINTTLGVGGFVDAASWFGLNYHDEDFGQTLAVWGSGEGIYLHLPLLGPSNPRDASGKLVDYVLDPLTWVGYVYNVSWINTTRFMVEGIDTRARNLETIAELQRGSVDFYATLRSLYRQHRNDAIKNGEDPEAVLSQITNDDMIPDDGAEMPIILPTTASQPPVDSNDQLSEAN
ncbi:MAG: VacJ family lipoprotein [Rhodospirillaceae bacterium]|nr:VacJ family lipoprotein [Rhodospirillaceae bacterium]